MSGERLNVMGTAPPANKGILVACTSAHMMNHIHLFILPALMPVFQRIFHLSYSQCSLLLAVYFLGMAVLNPIAGIWSVNHSKRWTVAAGICAGGGMLLVLSSVRSYGMLFSVLLFYGAFLTLYHPAGTALLANSFPENMRGKVMGVHSAGSSVGMIVGPLLIGIFLKESTYDRALWFFGLFSFIVAGLAFWLLKEVSVGLPAHNDKIQAGQRVREIQDMLRFPRFALALITYGIRDAIYWGIFIFLPLYLVHRFRYSEGGAAGMVSLVPLIGLVATITGGVIGDRFGRILTITAGMVVAGLGFLFIPVFPAQEILFYIVVVVATFAVFATVPLFDAAIADITPQRVWSVSYGYFFGLGAFLGGLVTILGGILSDLFSPQMAFLGLSAFSFLCACLAWRLKRGEPGDLAKSSLEPA